MSTMIFLAAITADKSMSINWTYSTIFAHRCTSWRAFVWNIYLVISCKRFSLYFYVTVYIISPDGKCIETFENYYDLTNFAMLAFKLIWTHTSHTTVSIDRTETFIFTNTFTISLTFNFDIRISWISFDDKVDEKY